MERRKDRVKEGKIERKEVSKRRKDRANGAKIERAKER
jgi:hypothetical protein